MVMLRLECDRCKNLSQAAPGLIGVDRFPQAQAGAPYGDYRIPNDWSKCRGQDLCPGCTGEVDRFIAQPPPERLRDPLHTTD